MKSAPRHRDFMGPRGGGGDAWGEQAPPFRNPPPCPGRWGRLRRSPPGLYATLVISGRSTHSPGRSPLLRATSSPPWGCKGEASSPLPEPPTLSGTLGAPSAQPSGPVREAGDLGKIDSFARAEPIATRHVISALLRGCKGGASSPLPEPPTLSGTLGAPAALPSGPVRDAGDLGKIDSFARAEPIATRHVISALLRGCKGGASSPLPEPPTLSGTLGAPSAQPSGPVREAGDLGKIESFARAEPIATRHVISVLLLLRGREHAGAPAGPGWAR